MLILMLVLLFLFMFIFVMLASVSNEPNEFILLTIFSQRTDIILGQGTHFLPLWRIVFGGARCDTRPDGFEVERQVILPDGSEVYIKAHISWRVDLLNAWTYADSDSRDTLNPTLKRIVEHQIQAWAASRDDGPQDWIEALDAYEELRDLLLNSFDPEAYGIEIIDVNIDSIRPAGRLAEQNIQDLKAGQVDVIKIVKEAKAGVLSLADLKRLKKEMIRAHPDLETEIDSFIEVARMKILSR